ncbi:hypothetical protein E2I00_004202, partial [Balaenoptera physalus]
QQSLKGCRCRLAGETFIMDSAYSEQAVLLLQRGRGPPEGTCTCAGYQKVPALALIELTTLCDVLGLDLKKSKAGKRKATETCLFSVSLDTLLEADRRSLPSTQIPLLLSCLGERGLDTSGILRVPGSKLWFGFPTSLRLRLPAPSSGLEHKLNHNDASDLLQMSIQALPAPLLTAEYLQAFPVVVQHDVLGKALLEFFPVAREPSNKMMLWSVSTEMAPHLFQHRGGPPKLPRGREKQLAEGAAEVVRMIAQYQDLPWTVAFLGGPGVKTERQHSPGLKTWLRRMHADRNEAMDGPELVSEPCTTAPPPQVEEERGKGQHLCALPRVGKVGFALWGVESLSPAGNRVLVQGEVSPSELKATEGSSTGPRSQPTSSSTKSEGISHRLDPDAHLLDLYCTNLHGEWGSSNRTPPKPLDSKEQPGYHIPAATGWVYS